MNKDLSKQEEIELFDALIWLLFRADREPADLIASLMVPLDIEAAHLLDEWTISSSAAFIRDYLKKDEVLATLKAKDKKIENR